MYVNIWNQCVPYSFYDRPHLCRYEVARNATVPINPLLARGKRLLLKDLFREEPSERLGVRDGMSLKPFRDHAYFQGYDWTEMDSALARILRKRSKRSFD